METFLTKEKKDQEIYFQMDYAKLYEKQEQGTAQIFDFSCKYGSVKNLFIKRKIPYTVNGKDYFDITTPYGYGGPVTSNVINLEKLLSAYFNAFGKYCHEQRIVSEFIRFHFFENEEVRKHFNGKVSLIGNHVIRDLGQPLFEDFDKSVKRSIRIAKKHDLEIIFDTAGDSLDKFLTVYYSTLQRNDAKDFYYFDNAFFNKLNQSLKDNFVYCHVLYDKKIVSTALVLYGENYAYGLFGGTLREYYAFHPNVFLEVETINWLKKKGLSYYILGGGHKGEDGIYKFKKNFAKKNGNYPFYVGKKIHDPEIYNALNDLRETEQTFDRHTFFFPSYRS